MESEKQMAATSYKADKHSDGEESDEAVFDGWGALNAVY